MRRRFPSSPRAFLTASRDERRPPARSPAISGQQTRQPSLFEGVGVGLVVLGFLRTVVFPPCRRPACRGGAPAHFPPVSAASANMPPFFPTSAPPPQFGASSFASSSYPPSFSFANSFLAAAAAQHVGSSNAARRPFSAFAPAGDLPIARGAGLGESKTSAGGLAPAGVSAPPKDVPHRPAGGADHPGSAVSFSDAERLAGGFANPGAARNPLYAAPPQPPDASQTFVETRRVSSMPAPSTPSSFHCQSYLSNLSGPRRPLSPEQIGAAAMSAAADGLDAYSHAAAAASSSPTWPPFSAADPLSAQRPMSDCPATQDSAAPSSSSPLSTIPAFSASAARSALPPPSSPRVPSAASAASGASLVRSAPEEASGQPVSRTPPPSVSSSPFTSQELLDLLYPAVHASSSYKAWASKGAASHAASSLSAASPRRPAASKSAVYTSAKGATASAASGGSAGSASHFHQLRCGLVVAQIDQRDLWRKTCSEAYFRGEKRLLRAVAASRASADGVHGGASDEEAGAEEARAGGKEEAAATPVEDREKETRRGGPQERSEGAAHTGAELALCRGSQSAGRTATETSPKSSRWVEETLEQVYLLREYGGIFAVRRRRPECLTLLECLGAPPLAMSAISSASVFPASISPSPCARASFLASLLRDPFSLPAPASPLSLLAAAGASPRLALAPLVPALAREWECLFNALRLAACSFWLLTEQAEAEIAEADRRYRRRVEMWQLQLKLRELQQQLLQHHLQAPRGNNSVVRHAWKVKRRALFHRYAQVAQAYRQALAEQQPIFAVSGAPGSAQVAPAQLFDANEILPNKRLFIRRDHSPLTLGDIGFPSCCCTDSAAAVAAAGVRAGLRRLPGCTDTCGCRLCIYGGAWREVQCGPVEAEDDAASCADETQGGQKREPGSDMPCKALGESPLKGGPPHRAQGESGAGGDALRTERDGAQAASCAVEASTSLSPPGVPLAAATASLSQGAGPAGLAPAEGVLGLSADDAGAGAASISGVLRRNADGVLFVDEGSLGSMDLAPSNGEEAGLGGDASGPSDATRGTWSVALLSAENGCTDGGASLLRPAALPSARGDGRRASGAEGAESLALLRARSASVQEDEGSLATSPTAHTAAAASLPALQSTSARADLDDEFEFDDADMEEAHGQPPGHAEQGLLHPAGSRDASSPTDASAASAVGGVPAAGGAGVPAAVGGAAAAQGPAGVGGTPIGGVGGGGALAAGAGADLGTAVAGGPGGVSGAAQIAAAGGSAGLAAGGPQALSGLSSAVHAAEDEIGGAAGEARGLFPTVLREPLWGEVEGTLECDMTRVHRLLHWKKKESEALAVAAACAAKDAASKAREKARARLLHQQTPEGSLEEEELAAISSAATAAALTVEEEEVALFSERTEMLRAAEAHLEKMIGKPDATGMAGGQGCGSTAASVFSSVAPFDAPLRLQQQSERFLFLFLSASFVLPPSAFAASRPGSSPPIEEVDCLPCAASPVLALDAEREAHGGDAGDELMRSEEGRKRESRGTAAFFAKEKQRQSAFQCEKEAILSCVFFDMNDDLLFRLNEELPEKPSHEEDEDEPAAGGSVSALAAAGGPVAAASSASSALAAGGTSAAVAAAVAAAGAFFESDAALAGVSRTAALRLRRKAKQEVLKLDKQKRIELVKQGKSALELHAMAAAEQETRSSKARSPLQEFVVTLGEFSLKEKSGNVLQRLNTSFDAFQETRRLHCRGKDQGSRGGIPLIHTKIAFQLQGVHPVAGRRGRLAMLRFHRPDFRAGLVSALRGPFGDVGSLVSSHYSREDRRGRTTGSQSADRTPWIVLPPEPSEVMRRLREELYGSASGRALESGFRDADSRHVDGDDERSSLLSGTSRRGKGLKGDASGGGAGDKDERGNAVGAKARASVEGAVEDSHGGGPEDDGDREQIHLVNHFYTAQDLSLRDDAPIAVFEYMEQQPLLMHNPGMAVRITRHFFPPSPPNADLGRQEQLQLAERQAKGRLGPFGELRLQQDDAKIILFGTRLPLARGQGQAVVESPLLKAPVYVHPSTPAAPLKRDVRFHDYRDTDFILVRTKAKDRWKVFLRPLLYPPPEKGDGGAWLFRASGGLESLTVLGSPGNCGVYTVGQCEPRMEVQAPNSKKHLDDRKLHAKAWALRLAAERNVTDMKRIKDLVKQRFCPPVIEKEVTQMLKLLSPIAPHRLPRLDDAALRSIIRPEVICCLEAAHAALYRLKAIGIMTLTSADGLSGVAQFIEKEERHAQEKVVAAKKRMKEIELKFRQQAEARLPAAGSDDGAKNAVRAQALKEINEACQRASAALVSVCTAYAESRIGKRYGHLVRFIEELLLLTPWNLTKECKDVLTNKGSAQFMLTGFGDPSGGRGEGISLIKRLNRERSGLSFLSGMSRGGGFSRDGARSMAGAFGPGGIFLGAHLGPGAMSGGVAGTGEDLRKLSMQELRRRLLQYGLSESVIRTLPRWDQVALVRQYRDGFGSADFAPPGGENDQDEDEDAKKNKSLLLSKGGRLRAEEYDERLVGILQRQKRALEADFPAITDTEEEEEEKEEPGAGDRAERDGQGPADAQAQVVDGHSGAGGAGAGNAAPDGQERGVEDALLAALDGEEEEKEADEDELERRELQVLRQRQEARAAKPLTAEEQQRADMKVQAVPCLRWIRRFRQQAGEPFGTERVILIYGEKNIKEFIQWRTRRLEDTRARMLASTRSKEALAGKRVCRACGQPGHIASNVNCPLYNGPKRPAAATTPPPPLKKRRKDNQQLEEDLLLMGLYASEGRENESEVNGGHTGNGSTLLPYAGTAGTPARGGRGGRGGRHAAAGAHRGAAWDDDDEDFLNDGASSVVSYATRRRGGARSVVSGTESHRAGAQGRRKASRKRGQGGGGGGGGRGRASRAGADEEDEEEDLEEDEEDEEGGRWAPGRSRRAAVDELNIALARIVNVVLQQQIFKPFWQRVDERYAPNYYKVIANPMWLQKVASKCKQREYSSGEQFLADIHLIVMNCFLFNPPNSPSAWLRERATNLEETVRQKFEEQKAVVCDCEAIIFGEAPAQGDDAQGMGGSTAAGYAVL
ncbi:hypothetical protein BESB_029800 [Besnoitia besnoiti]|uniref:Bromo domain-containing protein n=1 Tax=Besnoitia besnoiti TaxID=94643 RepID=A0A2A9M5B9_BESBE|nr:hypothetical protein BESB_029800 [Besnoitia besnoiti]PFH31106.1 hypothetical protein BESB_029800 [Besnoitia besnoiti]